MVLVLFSFSAGIAQAISLDGLDYVVLGSHDFFVEASSHGHDAHWSWVATPPSDIPTVTEVTYFVDSAAHGGSALTAAHLADITAAAGVWNAAGANLLLSEVFSDDAADIHLHMDTTSGCGGGAIGCAESAFYTAHSVFDYGPSSGHPEGAGATHPQHLMAGNTVAPMLQVLTMYDDSTFGGTWYSGSAGGIGGSQLDFFTVAIQELGHHLGLEHNEAGDHADFGSSPMNGSLPYGTTRRVLAATDIDAIVHLYGAASLEVVPEPSTLTLSLLGFIGLAAYSRNRRC